MMVKNDRNPKAKLAALKHKVAERMHDKMGAIKDKIAALPEETKAGFKADAAALRSQVKDHVQLTRQGAEAIRSQVQLAREDGTVTDEEKTAIKGSATALRTQAAGFRQEDKASFKALLGKIKDALTPPAPAPAPETV